MPQSSQLNDKKYPISLLTFLAVAFRSSGLEVFCKKCVFKNFAKLTGKQLRSEKKDTLAHVFSSEFFGISTNTFFSQNTSGGCFWAFAALFSAIGKSPFLLKNTRIKKKLLQKETPTRVISCEICKKFENTDFKARLHFL